MHVLLANPTVTSNIALTNGLSDREIYMVPCCNYIAMLYRTWLYGSTWQQTSSDAHATAKSGKLMINPVDKPSTWKSIITVLREK